MFTSVIVQSIRWKMLRYTQTPVRYFVAPISKKLATICCHCVVHRDLYTTVLILASDHFHQGTSTKVAQLSKRDQNVGLKGQMA